MFIFPSPVTGAWKAALVNTHLHGDKILTFETGHFAFMWSKLARKIGLHPEIIEGDWR